MTNKKEKILVSVSNDLLTDQRVHKVCSSLHEKGYSVLLMGCIKKGSASLQQRAYACKRMRMVFSKGFLFYAEYNLRLFFFLLVQKADFFLSNDTDTLVANFLASKIRRKKLVFDAHEIFPEVPELRHRPFVKRVWQSIEAVILPRLKNTYTVSCSIADLYKRMYGIQMRVVRNIPFYSDNVTPSLPSTLSSSLPSEGSEKNVLLYQGAVNKGRGLDWIIEAMPYLDNCILYVVGGGDILEEMKTLVQAKKLEERVSFFGRIPFEELSRYSREAKLGFCLLENLGLNYYYSLPNRIFDYMHAHIPVLATDFPEIRQLVEKWGIGECISHYEPVYLASRIKEILDHPPSQQVYVNAKAHFSWENEVEMLLEVIEQAK